MSADIGQVWLVTVKIPCLGTVGNLVRKAVLANDPHEALAAALLYATKLPEFPDAYKAKAGSLRVSPFTGAGELRIHHPSATDAEYENDVVVRVERVEVVS